MEEKKRAPSKTKPYQREYYRRHREAFLKSHKEWRERNKKRGAEKSVAKP